MRLDILWTAGSRSCSRANCLTRTQLIWSDATGREQEISSAAKILIRVHCVGFFWRNTRSAGIWLSNEFKIADKNRFTELPRGNFYVLYAPLFCGKNAPIWIIFLCSRRLMLKPYSGGTRSYNFKKGSQRVQTATYHDKQALTSRSTELLVHHHDVLGPHKSREDYTREQGRKVVRSNVILSARICPRSISYLYFIGIPNKANLFMALI